MGPQVSGRDSDTTGNRHEQSCGGLIEVNYVIGKDLVSLIIDG